MDVNSFGVLLDFELIWHLGFNSFFYFFLFWLGHDLYHGLGPNLAGLNRARRTREGGSGPRKKKIRLVNRSGPGMEKLGPNPPRCHS